MKENFVKVWKILDQKNKSKVILASALILISSIFDLLAVVSVLPFFTLIADTKALENNEYFVKLNDYLGLSNEESLIFFGFFSFVVIVINQLLRYASTQYNHKFLNNIYYEKTRELLEFYLNRPYKFILDKNNEVLIQRCTWMVNAATGFI